jgi:N-acetyl-anhydromuramyl-L-alanine amidase AmpD
MGFHTNQGWAGLSYHYVITKSGQIYQINDHDDLTWTDFDNVRSLAILVDGYFHNNKDKPTKEQLVSLELLLNDLSFNHPEFPAGQSNVLAHREVHATQNNGGTACCGDELFPFVVEFRESGKITVPAEPIPEPETVVENKIVQLENVNEIEKAFLETLKKKDSEIKQKMEYIKELEKTIQLYQMQNPAVKTDPVNPQIDGVNVKPDVLATNNTNLDKTITNALLLKAKQLLAPHNQKVALLSTSATTALTLLEGAVNYFLTNPQAINIDGFLQHTQKNPILTLAFFAITFIISLFLTKHDPSPEVVGSKLNV